MSTETLSLTNENVEKVLDELRPFLISDGGNVEIAEIDGPIVKVRLQGACGSCPSSTCLLYTSPSPRDLSTSRMPSSA